ncbi:YcxB family protein [Actinoplanes solisilvae]|uniref:YcxB family protein n=1 Tax=Actinoplanes solisilvae TaxID=2486853 RepID=UPI000FDBF86D|nr:YcxB family protein [Actinoplanes solisilvae]
MQPPIHSGVEVRIVRSRRDLRRTARTAYAQLTRRVGLGGLTAIAVGGVALCAEQLIVSAVCLLVGVIALTFQWWYVWLVIWGQPGWVDDPVTFRISEQGVEIETAFYQRLVRWEGMTQVITTPDAYFFGSREPAGIILHRRTLTTSDSAAIEAFIERYQAHVDNPLK